MNQPSNLQPRQTKSSRSSPDSRLAEIRVYVSRQRCVLGGLACLLIAGMVVGIIFAAHHYFVEFGGQGWLKVRGEEQGQSSAATDNQQLYLPLRQVEIPQNNWHWPWFKRIPPGANIPFYTCGDQQNSCETFGQPNICCPVGMACQPGEYSRSGIFCCNTSAAPWNCQTSATNPPKCMEATVECSGATGGGCCPSQLECSPNGCIHVTKPDNSTSNSTSTTSESSSVASTSDSSSILATRTNGIITTKTVTQTPPATQTLPKSGEIAQMARGSTSIVVSLCLPYAAISVLVGVAAIMGFL